MAGQRKDVNGMSALARLLKRLRNQANLTQEALGEASGVHRNQIWRYENEESMASPEIRAHLATGLGLEPADFELRLSKERERVLREQGGEDLFEQGPIEGQPDKIREWPRAPAEPLVRTKAFVRTMLEHEHEPEALISEDAITLAAEGILSLVESLKLACDPGRRASS